MAAEIMLITYDAERLEERLCASWEDFTAALGRPGVVWLHVQGLPDARWLQELGEQLKLHPLALEDVVQRPQRPKAEEYETHDFVLAHAVTATDHRFVLHQFSLFVGPNYLLSFAEDAAPIVEAIRQRLRTARGLIRQHGVDHLMYALLDEIVDSYFPVLEDFGDYLDEVQEVALWESRGDTIRLIQMAKRELRALRRVLWPLRELFNVLLRDDNDNVSPPVRHYLRDCYDRVIQLMDMVETYREMAADLMDAYLSAISNRMNAVMKMLTIIATLFMPLTFLVGVYGMNFNTQVSPWNMPELNWRYGYPFVWAIMLLCVAAMLFYFRWRGWIGDTEWLGEMPDSVPTSVAYGRARGGAKRRLQQAKSVPRKDK